MNLNKRYLEYIIVDICSFILNFNGFCVSMGVELKQKNNSLRKICKRIDPPITNLVIRVSKKDIDAE